MKELWIDGHFIEVTDEVYAAYVKGQRKIDYFEKDLKTEYQHIRYFPSAVRNGQATRANS